MSDPQTDPYVPQLSEHDTKDYVSLASTGAEGSTAVGTQGAVAATARRGCFTLLKDHAHGGLGKVSLAQDERLNRPVAIKEIRPDRRGNEQLRQRFVVEAEITSQLQHPGIVPIYAMDQGPDGEPFYAMRFVEGQTLAAAIAAFFQADRAAVDGRGHAARSLAFRDLLQRFVSTCQTVAYAHSKGVIHRDLKPANVMLGEYGETLVLDWGLAKRLSSSPDRCVDEKQLDVSHTFAAREELALTQDGQVLGTAPYMSPEQARGEESGPATDVYCLGAILYEILTGQRPYVAKSNQAILELVKRGALVAPSTVRPNVPMPLEAVCLKAMAHAPSARYGTATELANEVNRWLADEPVWAAPEPWLARTHRFVRKHRTLVTSGFLTLASAVLVLCVVLFLVDRSRRQITQEKEETEQQRQAAVAARERGSKIIEDVLSRQSLDALKRQGRLTADQEQFLRNVVGYYEELAAEQPGAPADHARMANAYHRIGIALDLLGNNQQARDAFQRAMAACQQLHAQAPDNPEYWVALAESQSSLSIVLVELKDHAQARIVMSESLRQLERWSADQPKDTRLRRQRVLNLMQFGSVCRELGDYGASRAAYLEAIAIQKELLADEPANPNYCRNLATSHNNLGLALVELGDSNGAAAAYDRAIAVQDKLATDHPGSAEYQYHLAKYFHNLAMLREQFGQWPAARQAYEKAQGLREKLVAEYPAVPEYSLDLALNHNGLGLVHVSEGKLDEARQAYHKAVARYEKLSETFPGTPEFAAGRARVLVNLAIALQRAREMKAARAAGEEALAITKVLVAQHPASFDFQQGLATAYGNLGILLQMQGDLQGARERCQEALAIKEKLATASPNSRSVVVDLCAAYVNLGHLLIEERDSAAALPLFARAMYRLTPLAVASPPDAQARLYLRNAYWGQADALDALGRHAEAVTAWEQALRMDGGRSHKALERGRVRSALRAALTRDGAWFLIWISPLW